MGLYLLWKNKNLSSGDALLEFKKRLFPNSKNRKGIGHTGTLDPFAEGLLLVGTNEGTKLLAALQGLPKTYEAKMLLGATSKSLDTESTLEIAPQNIEEKLRALTKRGLGDYLKSKIGLSEQIPPQTSAVHVDGKRAYQWERLGVTKDLKPRKIEIMEAQSLELKEKFYGSSRLLEWTFKVKVSAGTYIRALSRDFGNELISYPGMLLELRRTAIGGFEMGYPLENMRALKLEELKGDFDFLQVDQKIGHELRKFGRLRIEGLGLSNKKSLIVDEQRDCFAFIHANSSSVGRVFLHSPFES